MAEYASLLRPTDCPGSTGPHTQAVLSGYICGGANYAMGIFSFFAGALMTGLGLLHPTSPALGIAFVGLGAVGMVAAFLHAIWRYFIVPKVKSPTLQCSFSMKDIGGCVCPDTKLIRSTSIPGLPLTTHSSTSTMVGGPFSETGKTVTNTGATTDGGLGPRVAIFVDSIPVTYYRVKVSAQNGTVLGCKGRLESLKPRFYALICRNH